MHNYGAALSRGERYSSLSRFSHTLPACATRGGRERQRGVVGEQREVDTVSNHLLLTALYSRNPFSLSVHSQPKCRGRHACKETTAF